MHFHVTSPWIKYQQVFNSENVCTMFWFFSMNKLCSADIWSSVAASSVVARSRLMSLAHTLQCIWLFSGAIFYLVLLFTCLIITVWLNFYYCFSFALVILLRRCTSNQVLRRLRWGANALCLSTIAIQFESIQHKTQNSANKKHALRFEG